MLIPTSKRTTTRAQALRWQPGESLTAEQIAQAQREFEDQQKQSQAAARKDTRDSEHDSDLESDSES